MDFSSQVQQQQKIRLRQTDYLKKEEVAKEMPQPEYTELDGFAVPAAAQTKNPQEYFTFSGGVGPIYLATYYTQSNGVGVGKGTEAYWGLELGSSPQSSADMKPGVQPPAADPNADWGGGEELGDVGGRRRLQAGTNLAGAYTEGGFGTKLKEKSGDTSSQYEDKSQVTKITLKDGNTGDRFWSVFCSASNLYICPSGHLAPCLKDHNSSFC